MQNQFQNGLHVAIIMDGNGRWAARRGLPRVAGHRAGLSAARRIVEHAPDVGIGRLTLYAFSSDNWRRPAAEVDSIFWLLRAFLRLQTERLREQGARLEAIGRRDRLPQAALRAIENAEWRTAAGRRLHLRVAVDYSSRDAIARAAATAFAGKPTPNAEMTTPLLTDAMTAQAGDVDLLIRTGGEQRLRYSGVGLPVLSMRWPRRLGAELRLPGSCNVAREVEIPLGPPVGILNG